MDRQQTGLPVKSLFAHVVIDPSSLSNCLETALFFVVFVFHFPTTNNSPSNDPRSSSRDRFPKLKRPRIARATSFGKLDNLPTKRWPPRRYATAENATCVTPTTSQQKFIEFLCSERAVTLSDTRPQTSCSLHFLSLRRFE